jgi:hypothetical protein
MIPLAKKYRDYLIPEELFEEEFSPRKSPVEDGDYYEFDQVKDLPENTVWTIIDDGGATDCLYASPGFHVVNKIGYIVTQKPWDADTLDALWCDVPGPHEPLRTLTLAQLTALRTFAAAHGRNWKTPLRDAWMSGIYPDDDADNASLQQVRNQLGPTWLVKFRLDKRSTWSRYA